jgi:hypothetical protein
MLLQDIMGINLANPAEKQLNAYKSHVLAVLAGITESIKQDRYEDVESKTFLSPAGDAYGSDNHCINFGWDENDKGIVEACEELSQLRCTADRKCAPKGA